MSDLDRLLKLSGMKAQAQTQETIEDREMKEAVGEFAEPIYDLIDMHFEGDCQPVFDDLVRYLSGDQIKDFVADFRRHHDLPNMDEVDADTEESVEPTEPSTEEGNKFSGELAQAKKDGKDEFEVDGEKYKVKKEEFTNEDDLEEIEEATGKCEDCGCVIDDPTPGCDCPHDVHDASQDNWVKEANRLKELSGISTLSDSKELEEAPVEEGTNGCADCDWIKDETDGDVDTCDECAAEKRQANEGKYKSDAQRKAVHASKSEKANENDEAPVEEDAKSIPVNKLIPLAGDSIWDKEGENPKQIKVDSISITNPYESYMSDEEDDSYRTVNVEHDGPWTIYTDSGFEKAISELVGFDVDFTEQGMQEDGMASMEGMMNDSIKSEAFANYKPNRFKDMPGGMNEKETIEEAPTMDTTQLITLLKNSGLSEEQIKKTVNEWANTPAVGASEEGETSHGEPYENFAQSVNLSLKRYLDAEDMKVGLKEHKVDEIKEAYKKSKKDKK